MAKKTAEDRLKDLDTAIDEKAKERQKLIDELATKKAQEIRLKEKKAAIQTEKDRQKARKNDTARKILLGAFVAKLLKDEGERGSIHSWLEKDLPRFLTKDKDKELLIEFMGDWKPPVKEKKGE